MTQYEKGKSNSLMISVDSKTFTLPEEGKVQDPAKPEEDPSNRLNLLIISVINKTVSEKLLPNTGSE